MNSETFDGEFTSEYLYNEIYRLSVDRETNKIRVKAAETEVAAAEKQLAAVRLKLSQAKTAIELAESKIRNLLIKVK